MLFRSGQPCSKLNLTQNVGTLKYTCIKSGSKLVWHQSNASLIRNFSDLNSRYLDFHEIARIKATSAMTSENPKSIQVNVRVGPNSKLCYKSPEIVLKQISNLYSQAKQPNVINLLVADDKDQGWLESETRELLPDDQIEIVNGKMMNPEKVNRLTGEGVVWIQNSCRLRDLMTTSGGAQAHGFTHLFQINQFFPQSNTWGAWGKIPRWLLEGGATFSENIVALGSSSNSWQTAAQFHNGDLKKYDQQFFLDFLKLSDQGWAYTDKWPNQRVYDVGSLACEILIAIGSPSDLINLYSEYQLTQDFDKALFWFKHAANRGLVAAQIDLSVMYYCPVKKSHGTHFYL